MFPFFFSLFLFFVLLGDARAAPVPAPFSRGLGGVDGGEQGRVLLSFLMVFWFFF